MDYKFLESGEVSSYLAGRTEILGLIDPESIESVEEVGDGNLNLVFIVFDKLGRSLVLKQALPYVRLVGPDWPMTPFRAEREAEALRIHGELNPELVPSVYFYDPERFIICMENLASYHVWRGALINGERHEGAGYQMGQYVGEIATGTSTLLMDQQEQKILAAKSINPELCKITEDLVFTEPYFDIGRNSVLPENLADAEEHSLDKAMMEAMAEAKWKFMTRAEALIHGDLHTGSVMVKFDSGTTGSSKAKAFDSEFAFYGPVAFDLGALWANYVIAGARAIALGENEFAEWIISQVSETWNGFEDTVRRRIQEKGKDPLWNDVFIGDMLSQWQEDAWLFAAAKMSRRVVGLAKAADIETLEPAKREGAARGILRLSRLLSQQRLQDSSPASFQRFALETLISNRTA